MLTMFGKELFAIPTEQRSGHLPGGLNGCPRCKHPRVRILLVVVAKYSVYARRKIVAILQADSASQAKFALSNHRHHYCILAARNRRTNPAPSRAGAAGAGCELYAGCSSLSLAMA